MAAYTAHGPLGHGFRGYGSFAGRTAPPFSKVHFSHHGPLGHAFRGYGSFAGRVATSHNEYSVGNSPMITYEVFAPTWLPDNVYVLEAGTQITEESFSPLFYAIETPFSVSNSPEIVYTVFNPTYITGSAGDNYFVVSNAIDVLYEVFDPTDTSDRSFTVSNVPIIVHEIFNPTYFPNPTGTVDISQATISAIVNAVLNGEIEPGGFTLKNSQRVMLAATGGPSFGFKGTDPRYSLSEMYGYKNPPGTKNRVTIRHDGTANRVIITYDLND